MRKLRNKFGVRLSQLSAVAMFLGLLSIGMLALSAGPWLMQASAGVANTVVPVIYVRTVTSGGVPIAGAAVSLTGDAKGFELSDAAGNVLFNNTLAGGTYLVAATSQLYDFTPENYEVLNLQNDVHITFIGEPISTPTPTPCTPAPDGLISWWPGEDNVLDVFGANNGVLRNNTTFGAGKVGRAIKMNGNGDYVEIRNSADLNPANITLETWVNFTSLDSTATGNPVGNSSACSTSKTFARVDRACSVRGTWARAETERWT